MTGKMVMEKIKMTTKAHQVFAAMSFAAAIALIWMSAKECVEFGFVGWFAFATLMAAFAYHASLAQYKEIKEKTDNEN